MNSWWETFFDADYVRIWEAAELSGQAERQASGPWSTLNLRSGCSVLDAPCGYGRISTLLAEQGARVLGVDLSKDQLAEAERRRGQLSSDQLRYLQHDLRQPLNDSGFDVALNLYSSLGYGSEEDDVAVLSNLRNAVRPGGVVFIERTIEIGMSRSLHRALPAQADCLTVHCLSWRIVSIRSAVESRRRGIGAVPVDQGKRVRQSAYIQLPN
jgi:2-polyprenyl-3-methyl-5-hydroxy-6-metoxy-1,4-benzoquinol methylase